MSIVVMLVAVLVVMVFVVVVLAAVHSGKRRGQIVVTAIAHRVHPEKGRIQMSDAVRLVPPRDPPRRENSGGIRSTVVCPPENPSILRHLNRTSQKIAHAGETGGCGGEADRIIVAGVAGPRQFSIRQPAVAGLFYPADPAQCRATAAALVRRGSGQDVKRESDVKRVTPSERPLGGIVPHAGWVCSGAIAGEAIGTLAAMTPDAPPDVVVVFGAIHTGLLVDAAVLSTHDAWHEPSGDSAVAGEIKAKLTESGGGRFSIDDRFHSREHAVEVELPLIQAAWPGVRVLPVEVPVSEAAVEVGRRTARATMDAGLRAVFLASSDLTHYGPSYRFTPAGIGPEALAWAKDNDRRLLDVVTAMDAEGVVPEVWQNRNACGGGAIAAMLAACRECGATGARVLRHANSYETLASVAPQPAVDAVGYAAVVVHS